MSYRMSFLGAMLTFPGLIFFFLSAVSFLYVKHYSKSSKVFVVFETLCSLTLVTFCWLKFEHILLSMKANSFYYMVSSKTWIFKRTALFVVLFACSELVGPGVIMKHLRLHVFLVTSEDD